ncbi:hypothetical protein GQ53DRAFT_695047, partial [Thozetella sp. PMI_491]
MLKTCSRCRSRRIKCDARLPSCVGCHKSGLPCSYYDDALKENIPRSYIKSLCDRIDELQALVFAHPSTGEDNPTTLAMPDLGLFQCFVPYRTNHYMFLGPSPPVVIGNVAIAKVQHLGVQVESPPGALAVPDHELPPAGSKHERSSISLGTVRFLLAHYARCIEPLYPTLAHCGQGIETDLKQLGEDKRCGVLLTCAVAAVHKSYHAPAWRAIAKTCREWADDLASPLLEKRDDRTVFILLMLILYELADDERGLTLELLSSATRVCFELGWHRADEDGADNRPSNDGHLQGATDIMAPDDRQRLLSVLISIERPLTILWHRSPMLGGSISSKVANSDIAYNGYRQIIQDYFGKGVKRHVQECPMQDSGISLIRTLQSMPSFEPMTREAWLLLYPFISDHVPCESCLLFSSSPRDGSPPGLHRRVLCEAIALIESVHVLMTSQDTFIPPMFATSRAFMAACVLITGIASHWPGSESCSGPLLKCSELLSFTAPLWKGGLDYFTIYRQLSRAI